jgi:hypothetical protein
MCKKIRTPNNNKFSTWLTSKKLVHLFMFYVHFMYRANATNVVHRARIEVPQACLIIGRTYRSSNKSRLLYAELTSVRWRAPHRCSIISIYTTNWIPHTALCRSKARSIEFFCTEIVHGWLVRSIPFICLDTMRNIACTPAFFGYAIQMRLQCIITQWTKFVSITFCVRWLYKHFGLCVT